MEIEVNFRAVHDLRLYVFGAELLTHTPHRHRRINREILVAADLFHTLRETTCRRILCVFRLTLYTLSEYDSIFRATNKIPDNYTYSILIPQLDHYLLGTGLHAGFQKHLLRCVLHSLRVVQAAELQEYLASSKLI